MELFADITYTFSTNFIPNRFLTLTLSELLFPGFYNGNIFIWGKLLPVIAVGRKAVL